MSKYGRVIDDLDLDRESFYDLVTEYFDNPDMFKLKNENGNSVYVCKLQTMLKNGNRYLFAICEQDNFALDTPTKLKDLKWNCFQTRTLDDYYNYKKHNYEYKRGAPYNTKIVLVNREESRTEYSCSTYPNILITLLHSKPNKYEYPDQGNIVAALETFKTIFTFN